jgi:predicted transcriptional regulator
MARMSDEQYVFMQDCKEKKNTARSARNVRTHCGKRGGVKFPSDYMTKKEKEAMNGECKSYRMNDPIGWEEFKSWPKEHQETYIKLLKQKFGVTLSAISEMMGVHRTTLPAYVTHNKLKVGECVRGNHTWDKEGFEAWCNKGKEVEAQKKFDEEIEKMKDAVAESFKDVYSAESNSEIDNMVDEINKAWNESLGKSIDNVKDWGPIDEWNEINTEKNYEIAKQATCKIGESHTVIPCNGEMTFQGNVDDILRTISKLLDGRQVRLEVEWEVLG